LLKGKEAYLIFMTIHIAIMQINVTVSNVIRKIVHKKYLYIIVVLLLLLSFKYTDLNENVTAFFFLCFL